MNPGCLLFSYITGFATMDVDGASYYCDVQPVILQSLSLMFVHLIWLLRAEHVTFVSSVGHQYHCQVDYSVSYDWLR